MFEYSKHRFLPLHFPHKFKKVNKLSSSSKREILSLNVSYYQLSILRNIIEYSRSNRFFIHAMQSDHFTISFLFASIGVYRVSRL